MPDRAAGLLLHVSSLPSPGPIGDLGPTAHAFVRWLESAGCRLWQVLPLNPTGPGLSPYASPSAFAANPDLLSVELLVAEGLLPPGTTLPWTPVVDDDALLHHKRPLLLRAARSLVRAERAAVEAWACGKHWALDQALHQALAAEHGPAWQAWPEALRHRDAAALGAARDRHAARVEEQLALQLLLDRQLAALKAEAARRGVVLVGDMPLFVAADSCDVWSRPDLFDLDPLGQPRLRAGVPPDYFSPDGQLWGNPMYAWAAHEAEGFAWWRARVQRAQEVFSLVRIDHFRGLAAGWGVPPEAETAREGAWVPAPGRALLQHLPTEALIAEDLGTIDAEVEALRDGFGLPGMKVLQFAFGDAPDHPFLPHTWTHDRWVVYTGTHDNDTVRGWYDAADERTRDHLRRYVARSGHEPSWDLLRLAWSSVAGLAVAPLQDVLELDGRHRMNVPGTASGNWRWRVDGARVTAGLGARLAELGRLYSRV